PERPRVMGQFAGCIQGMGEACRALSFPIVSGNVSLYNETSGKGIHPTPVIGGVGLLDDAALAVGIGFTDPDLTILLVGETQGWLGCSAYLRELLGQEEGAPPPVDLDAELRNGDFTRMQILARRARACHDLSEGGLAVALAEMALAGGIGAEIAAPPGEIPLHAWLFGEDQARYLIATKNPAAVLADAEAAGIPLAAIGSTGGEALTLPGTAPISLTALREAHEGWLPGYMDGA
ncbi:MAG: phosphoribosylformylglycinamidine synthase II, partial [Rhodospirillaceae bacterium]|nr:phosphoribosylformylglycinamidine synthase II [Rhodospirillaceae bacterium]